MILSFPIGAYVVFNSNIGNEINFQYPLDGFNFFLAGISYKLPISFEIGDCFILIWSIYLILFSISLIGPQSNFMKTLGHIMSEGWKNIKENALINAITWFSILIFVSITIDFIQSSVGVKIESPTSQNNLINFFQLTLSPITEELGFRVMLIGIPLFLLFSHHATLTKFCKSLWRPSFYLHVSNNKKIFTLIITVGLFFGVAHIISGNPWSTGKFAQAAISGTILGWVYVRYGLAPAILIHWATNFFIFSYSYFMADLNQIAVSSDFADPFSNMLENILIIAGIISLTIKILIHIESRKKSASIMQS